MKKQEFFELMEKAGIQVDSTDNKIIEKTEDSEIYWSIELSDDGKWNYCIVERGRKRSEFSCENEEAIYGPAFILVYEYKIFSDTIEKILSENEDLYSELSEEKINEVAAKYGISLPEKVSFQLEEKEKIEIAVNFDGEKVYQIIVDNKSDGYFVLFMWRCYLDNISKIYAVNADNIKMILDLVI